MDKKILESYKKAGKINSQVREEVLKMVRPGMKILDLAEFIEKRIEEIGGKPAFPVNIGINEVTAHYTPSASDKTEIKKGDLVKIDVGVHVDGYVADHAFTYCSEKNGMIEVAEKALEAGISVIKPGVRVTEISKAINGVVEKAGLGVVINLTGHGLEQYVIHGPPKIPNVGNDSGEILDEGMVVAIEPFVLESNGIVKDSEPVEIFSFMQTRPVRLPEARKILDMAGNEYNGLPFCKRWMVKKGFSPFKTSFALKQLETVDAMKGYPVLKESRGKPVAQAEHTVIVGNPSVVTTR
ncbi:MAG: type II methionyl aminopeptidase [Candidatus Aenigmarchaeota archaeon]|nr:type II methionyl aminopeptidase [Candidatus Aenigmarchaeota archaeon]